MERLTEKHFVEKGYYLKCSEMCEEMNCSFCEHDSDALDKLGEYEDAEEQGLLARIDERFALAMLAGARAIEQNPRKYFGATFVCDVFGDKPKKISYHDAAKMLREKAEAALKED